MHLRAAVAALAAGASAPQPHAPDVKGRALLEAVLKHAPGRRHRNVVCDDLRSTVIHA